MYTNKMDKEFDDRKKESDSLLRYLCVFVIVCIAYIFESKRYMQMNMFVSICIE
jgi:hypothetical protein